MEKKENQGGKGREGGMKEVLLRRVEEKANRAAEETL